MPNGGSDCCGTCWFNSDLSEEDVPIEDLPHSQIKCLLRDLIIENPYWTYCSNHPAQISNKIEIPIGPVYIVDPDSGFSYRRKVWVESPDTKAIREALLEMLGSIQEQPRSAYMVPSRIEEAIIYQLMQFREKRAVPILRRICQFSPFVKDSYGFRDRVITIAYAFEGLAGIIGDEALPDLEQGVTFGLDKVDGSEKDTEVIKERARLATIRYFSVRGVQHCSPNVARVILQQAFNDPDEKVTALAKELFANLDS